MSIIKGLRPSDLPCIKQMLSVNVKERFMISDDYSSLPINVGIISFAKSNNCKKLMVMNTIDSLTTGESITG